MRKILSSRIFRILVCLALICCFLVNSSPIKAEATGVGAVLGVIKGASLVSVPVAFWAAAALIAIGVVADQVNDINYLEYQGLVDNVTAFLTDAGTYVKDGMVDMYRVIDETGKAVYYAAGDAMEAVRSWLFDSGTCLESSVSSTYTFIDDNGKSYAFTTTSPVTVGCYWNGTQYSVYVWSPVQCKYSCGILSNCLLDTHQYGGCGKVVFSGTKAPISGAPYYGSGQSESYYQQKIANSFSAPFVASDAVSLGQVPTVPIDGTGAREWSEEYTNNGLYIVGTGGSGNNNPNNGKWFWPLAFGLTAAELYAMSQADQWAGETPSEFSDYEVKEDYSVSPGQEVEFGQSVELTPDSSANPDPGTGTNPGTGTDPDTGTTTDPDSGSSSWHPPDDIGKFTLDLKDYFPFCIPFDMYDFFTCLNAEPVAPVIEWIIPLPGGESYPLELDLSVFDPVAQLLRRLELLAFCVGLAFKTRDLIKG